MRSGRPSRTAEAAAALRALHQLLDDEPLVLVDPYAARFLGLDPGPLRASAATALRSRLLRDRRLRRSLPPWLGRRPATGIRRTRAQIVVRSRYAEDALEQALAQGVAQYVILAAGLDSFAFRRPELLERLPVFEVDHPATQELKRRGLERLGLSVPPALVFVPVDFERETLAQALARSPYDPERPAFFSWLGVSYYLTEVAIRETLEFVTQQAQGSQMVLDYWREEGLRSAADRALLGFIRVAVAAQGEPMRSFFGPAEMAELMRRSGLTLRENVSPGDAGRRYLAGRTDGLVLPEFAYLGRVAVA